MFTFLYELLIGPNDNPTYRDTIFPFVGLFTLIFGLIITIVFYIALGRKWPVWYKLSHWVICLIVLVLFTFSFAMTNAKNATGLSDTYNMQFALANSFYTFIYFIIFSLIFKRYSIFAKRTPF